MHILQKIEKAGVRTFPKYMTSNLCYLALCGSESYGVSQSSSDKDLKGWAIPSKDMVYPYATRIHLVDPVPESYKINKQTKNFTAVKYAGNDYDFEIHYINKMFKLLAESNPTAIDILFVREEFVLHSNEIGELVRSNRKKFLSKSAVEKYIGYAYGQLRKIREAKETGNRAGLVQKYGYDIKHGYHTVRNLNQIEQILTKKDLDLMENREQLKSIRRGEWTLEDLTNHFQEKQPLIEKLALESDLQQKVDKEFVRELHRQCIEMHYGKIDGYEDKNLAQKKLDQIKEILL